MTTPEPHPVIPPMTRTEAVEWATAYADKNALFVAPTNSRGYTVDGWKAPSVHERMQVILHLANWILEGGE